MALRQTRKMPPFDGFAASSTATLRCPIGLTYHSILVKIDGPTVAQLTELRVLVNGVAMQRYNAAELLKYNVYMGAATTAEYYHLFFDRIGLLTRTGETLTAYGTGMPDDPTPIQTMTLEVDIASGATTTDIEAWAIQTAPSAAGVVRKIHKFIRAVAAAGDLQVSDLPQGDLISSMYWVVPQASSALNMNRLRVEVNNFTIFDRTIAANAVIAAQYGKRTPLTNQDFTFDTTEAGYGADAIVTQNISDLRFTGTFVAANTGFSILVEYIGPVSV